VCSVGRHAEGGRVAAASGGPRPDERALHRRSLYLGAEIGPSELEASAHKATSGHMQGIILAICPMERQRVVCQILAEIRELPIRMDRLGSRMVL
jgi:hypothetical protein